MISIFMSYPQRERCYINCQFGCCWCYVFVVVADYQVWEFCYIPPQKKLQCVWIFFYKEMLSCGSSNSDMWQMQFITGKLLMEIGFGGKFGLISLQWKNKHSVTWDWSFSIVEEKLNWSQVDYRDHNCDFSIFLQRTIRAIFLNFFRWTSTKFFGAIIVNLKKKIWRILSDIVEDFFK